MEADRENFVWLGDARVALGGAVWEVAGVKYLHATLLVAGIWLAGEFAWTVHRIRPHLEVTLSNLDKTIIVAGVAATHLEKASRTWESSSQEQVLQTTKAMSNVSAAASRLSSFISRTDNSLNVLLAPSINNAIVQENQSLLKTQADLQENLLELSKAISQSNKVLSDADAQINNPAIKESVDSLAEAAQNTASATSEAAASMTKVREGVTYEVNELMKPVRKAKVVLLFIAQIAGKFLGY